MTNPIVQLDAIHKSFVLPTAERIDVLRGVNLEVTAGEVIAIIGRSGSGKSTLLNILGLLEEPTDGAYRCEGNLVYDLPDRRLSRLRGEFVGFIFQQFFLLDRRTALENVAEPMLFADRISFRRRNERALELLETVELGHRIHSKPHLLSGGEKQRVAIARALVRDPRLILADEPTGSLDTRTGEQVMRMLMKLSRDRDKALIIVTHDRDIAAKADRVYRLNEGVLEEAP